MGKCDCDECNRKPRCRPCCVYPEPVVPIECCLQKQTSYCVPLTYEQSLIGLVGGTGFGALSGFAGVTGNVSNIHAVLRLRFDASMTKIKYALYVYNAVAINNRVTYASLNIGSASENGPVVVELFNGLQNVNGLLVKGYLYNSNIIGQPEANTVASLFELIQQRRLYVAVATELSALIPAPYLIRGQIF